MHEGLEEIMSWFPCANSARGTSKGSIDCAHFSTPRVTQLRTACNTQTQDKRLPGENVGDIVGHRLVLGLLLLFPHLFFSSSSLPPCSAPSASCSPPPAQTALPGRTQLRRQQHEQLSPPSSSPPPPLSSCPRRHAKRGRRVRRSQLPRLQGSPATAWRAAGSHPVRSAARGPGSRRLPGRSPGGLLFSRRAECVSRASTSHALAVLCPRGEWCVNSAMAITTLCRSCLSHERRRRSLLRRTAPSPHSSRPAITASR